MSQRFYDDQEAEQILSLAARGHPTGGGMTRERLLATAAELGITPEAVEEAETAFAAQKSDAAARMEFDRHVKSEFFTHLATFVIVNTFLVLINLVTSPRFFWAIFPILGMGLGVAIHGVLTVSKGNHYEEEYEKWLNKRQRKAYDREKAASLVSQWFTVHPDDTEGGIDYLRKQLAITQKDARFEVERHLVRRF